MENKVCGGRRRSSILKPTRSPTRNPLSEHNTDNQEKRKSLGNKRVSFADKHEVTEFIRDSSKDMGVSQDALPICPGSILMNVCMPFDGSAADVQISEGKENCPVPCADLNTTMVTQFFNESMCEVTGNISDEEGVKSSQQCQHNITDNLLEDMSLTLTIAPLPSILYDPVSTAVKPVVEKGFAEAGFPIGNHGIQQDPVVVWEEPSDNPFMVAANNVAHITSKNVVDPTGENLLAASDLIFKESATEEADVISELPVHDSSALVPLELPSSGVYFADQFAADTAQNVDSNPVLLDQPPCCVPEASHLEMASCEQVVETNGIVEYDQLLDVKENCQVPSVDANTMCGTKYFNDSMCDMSTDKLDESEGKIEVKEDRPKQHYVTDHFMEDMSLTFTTTPLHPLLCEPPITDYELPITDYEPPITDYESPITDYEPPITDYEPPNTDYEPPNTDYEPPITDYEPPITDYESPITDYEPPITDCKPADEPEILGVSCTDDVHYVAQESVEVWRGETLDQSSFVLGACELADMTGSKNVDNQVGRSAELALSEELPDHRQDAVKSSIQKDGNAISDVSVFSSSALGPLELPRHPGVVSADDLFLDSVQNFELNSKLLDLSLSCVPEISHMEMTSSKEETETYTLGLEEEVKTRLLSDLVVEEWTYEVVRLSRGLVHFTFGCKGFYLKVDFGEQAKNDDASLGRRMHNIEVLTAFPDDAFPENPISMKMFNYHKKVDFEEYQHSSVLPELLVKLTDPFFRCRAILKDLFMLRANLVTPVSFSDDRSEVQVRLVSTRAMVVIVLSFNIKFDTYPFAAIRPHFLAKSPEGSELRSAMLEAMMEEKTGEFYLWRMYEAARNVLRRREQAVTDNELKRLHSAFFITTVKSH